MGRYVFQPMDFNEYMVNYIKTLKTGELLVDLSTHDFYVTDEGYQIPIPVSKNLRQAIIEFLNNDLEGIKIRMSLMQDRNKVLEILYKKIREQQEEMNKVLKVYDNNISLENRESEVFFTNLTKFNLNRLGTLELRVDSILNEPEKQDKVINDLIAQLNQRIHDYQYYNSTDTYNPYNTEAELANQELEYNWREIQYLFTQLNARMEKLIQFNIDGGELTRKYEQYSDQTIDTYKTTNTYYPETSETTYVTKTENVESVKNVLAYDVGWVGVNLNDGVSRNTNDYDDWNGLNESYDTMGGAYCYMSKDVRSGLLCPLNMLSPLTEREKNAKQFSPIYWKWERIIYWAKGYLYRKPEPIPYYWGSKNGSSGNLSEMKTNMNAYGMANLPYNADTFKPLNSAETGIDYETIDGYRYARCWSNSLLYLAPELRDMLAWKEDEAHGSVYVPIDLPSAFEDDHNYLYKNYKDNSSYPVYHLTQGSYKNDYNRQKSPFGDDNRSKYKWTCIEFYDKYYTPDNYHSGDSCSVNTEDAGVYASIPMHRYTSYWLYDKFKSIYPNFSYHPINMLVDQRYLNPIINKSGTYPSLASYARFKTTVQNAGTVNTAGTYYHWRMAKYVYAGTKRVTILTPQTVTTPVTTTTSAKWVYGTEKKVSTSTKTGLNKKTATKTFKF